jgi:adenylate kinase
MSVIKSVADTAADCARAATGVPPRVYVILGAPGVGKGTQARLFAERFGLPQISTGDILRALATEDTPLGRELRATLAAGRLASDELLARVIQERTSAPDCAAGYILDGFPRTPRQAELLEEIAARQGKEILVLKLIVPRASLVKRLTGRRTCPRCGEIYNVYLKPPRFDETCDRDGTPLTRRSDDNEETVSTRVATYEQLTKPLTDYYLSSGRLVKIQAEKPVAEVFDELCAAAAEA